MTKGLLLIFKAAGICWLISIQLTPDTARATDDLTITQYIPDYLTFDYGLDNDQGRNIFVFTNLGLTLKERLYFGMGEQVEKVSRSEESLNNITYLLGYTYLPYSIAQIGAEYEFWGDKDKVTVNSIRAVLAVNTGKFAVTLTPEFRSILVENNSQCDKEINGKSAKIDLSLEISKKFTIYAGYVSYNYHRNLSELVNCVLNSEKLETESRIESVADDTQTSFGVDYFSVTETYGGNLLRSKTALLGENSQTLSLYASTDQFDDWTLTATTGITENTDDSTTVFITGTVTYYW